MPGPQDGQACGQESAAQAEHGGYEVGVVEDVDRLRDGGVAGLNGVVHRVGGDDETDDRHGNGDGAAEGGVGEPISVSASQCTTKGGAEEDQYGCCDHQGVSADLNCRVALVVVGDDLGAGRRGVRSAAVPTSIRPDGRNVLSDRGTWCPASDDVTLLTIITLVYRVLAAAG